MRHLEVKNQAENKGIQKIALIHSYMSFTVKLVLPYLLQLKDKPFDKIIVVNCRWSNFPDLGFDDLDIWIATYFEKQIEDGTIVVLNHQGVLNHTEFECRADIMNKLSDHIRMWVDSDELIYGRFWHINHAEEGKAYKIRHTLINQDGVSEFEGIPYLFGSGVTIRYTDPHFLSLEAIYNGAVINPEYIPELGNLSISHVEEGVYTEAKKSWVSNWIGQPSDKFNQKTTDPKLPETPPEPISSRKK